MHLDCALSVSYIEMKLNLQKRMQYYNSSVLSFDICIT